MSYVYPNNIVYAELSPILKLYPELYELSGKDLNY